MINKINKNWFIDKINSCSNCEYSMRGLARSMVSKFNIPMDAARLSRVFDGKRKVTLEEVEAISSILGIDRIEMIDRMTGRK